MQNVDKYENQGNFANKSVEIGRIKQEFLLNLGGAKKSEGRTISLVWPWQGFKEISLILNTDSKK